MQQTGLEALIARLDTACEGASPGHPFVVASDGDHTVWRGDIGDAVFDRLMAEEGVREEARSRLMADCCRVLVEPPPRDATPTDLATRLNAAYREGRFAEAEAFAMMAWVFAGWLAPDVDALCEAALDGVGFAQMVRPEMAHVIAWADRASVPFYLVSASPEVAVRAAARRLGIPEERAVGMRVATKDNRLLDRLDATPTYQHGKWQRLMEHAPGATLVAGFGDGAWDAELLRHAMYPVAVEPSEGLSKALAGNPAALRLSVGASP